MTRPKMPPDRSPRQKYSPTVEPANVSGAAPRTAAGQDHHLYLHACDGFVEQSDYDTTILEGYAASGYCPAEPGEKCGYVAIIFAIEAEAASAAGAAAALLGCYDGRPHTCRRCGVDIAAYNAPAPLASAEDNGE